MSIRKLFLFALVLIMGVQAKAQTVTVDNVGVVPGKTGEFTVCLTGGKNDKYTSMTLNVQFPKTGFSTTNDSVVLSPSWLGEGALTEGCIGAVDAEGLAIIPFASSVALAGGDVKEELVTICFNVADNVPYGDYNVTLKGTEFGYNLSDKDIANDVTFQMQVVRIGDVNGDGVVNVFDINDVVRKIQNKPIEKFYKLAANASADDVINVFDINEIVRIIQGKK